MRVDLVEVLPNCSRNGITDDEFADFLFNIGIKEAGGVVEQEVVHCLLFHLAEEVGIGCKLLAEALNLF